MTTFHRALDGVEAVLFDFNGTLSDDEDLLAELFASVSEHLSGTTVEEGWYERHCLGRSDAAIAVLMAGHVGRPDLAHSILDGVAAGYIAEVRHRPRVTQATIDTVKSLAATGLSLGVVTGTLRSMLEPALHSCGLDAAFACTVTIEDVSKGKPDPEGFLRGFALLGVDPAKGLVVEDSRVGVAAGRDCGARVAVLGSVDAFATAHHHLAEVSDLVS